ncbi:MAG: MauE/DoxX family redox-associated membrane protein [Tumebacillaceae bacterium]
MSSAGLRIIRIVLQLALAGVFLYSAYSKFADIYMWGEVLRSYDLLPDALIKPLAILIPMGELLIGAGLLIPLTVRWAANGSALLSLFFAILMVSKWGEVMPYGCGCFGPAEAKAVGFLDVGKDLLFLAMAGAILLLAKQTRTSR